MTPLFGLSRTGGLGPLHPLFRIDAQDQADRDLFAVCQLHHHSGNLARVALGKNLVGLEDLQVRPTDASYSGKSSGAFCLARRAQLVLMPPGSRLHILTPKGATSIARASLKPPTAHLAAWYGVLPATARRPPTEDTWKM